MKAERRVLNVTFADEGIVVHYVEKDDVRVGGAVAMQRMVQLDAGHPDYGDDIEDLHRAAVRTLNNALEDWESSPPHELPSEDEDPDRGMGE